MFKKLRIKFIAITMVMVAIVMALAFSAVCVSEQQRSLSVVQTALSDTAHGVMEMPLGSRPSLPADGELSSDGIPLEKPWGHYGKESSSSAASDIADQGDIITFDERNQGNAARPNIGGRQGQHHATSSLVPVAVYAIGADGSMSMIPEATSADISSDLLVEAAEVAMGSSEGFGLLDDLGLHYYKLSTDESTILAFADTSYTDGWKTLALTLLVAGLCTLAVFFVISLFFSKWALKPVREAWDSQRQFVADASHDLKTPLTVILANASILLKHADHTIASESQWVESTKVEAESMQSLVNEMLELAQVESSDIAPLPMDNLDFSDLVDGETLLFDSVALERCCVYECDVQSGIHVRGNEERLNKMVSTIVENAFKYVDEGGTVDVRLAQSGKSAELRVCNTGTAISPEDLPHIFDRFYRTDKARTSGSGGFGLGLAIAREIARAHGGDITCTSNAQDGTTFTITLPLAS